MKRRLFAALALGLYLIYLSKLTGQWGRAAHFVFGWVPGMNVEPPDVPFVEGNFVTMLFFIGAALAITLGFRQSAWEPSQGTALYLLHLPLARRTIFLTKLMTGIGLLLGCTLLADPDLCDLGRHAGNASRSVRMVDDRAGVSSLAAHAARVSRGVRQRHPPGTLVRLAALAPRLGGGGRLHPGGRGPMVADRSSRSCCSWRPCSSAISSGKLRHAIFEAGAVHRAHSA